MYRGYYRVLRGGLGCILCQKWLRLSSKVDECKPLPTAMEVPLSSVYTSSPGAAHRPTPPHALRMSTPAARAVTARVLDFRV